MVKLALAVALILFTTTAASAQTGAWHCGRNYGLYLYHKGDARMLRLAQQTKERGGGIDAVHSLRNTRDFVSVNRETLRACRNAK